MRESTLSQSVHQMSRSDSYSLARDALVLFDSFPECTFRGEQVIER
jgi:hypothetical protein